jgi:hypothetical protein
MQYYCFFIFVFAFTKIIIIKVYWKVYGQHWVTTHIQKHLQLRKPQHVRCVYVFTESIKTYSALILQSIHTGKAHDVT